MPPLYFSCVDFTAFLIYVYVLSCKSHEKEEVRLLTFGLGTASLGTAGCLGGGVHSVGLSSCL